MLGILAHGFCLLYCADCRRDRLVAFSCKGRSLCSCCGVRRMADGAAHLVDRVLPQAPVRQWVLSLPYALRFVVGFDAALCGEVLALFIGAVKRFYRHRAKAHWGLASVEQAHTGSVTAIQRFGSGLGLNVHFHSLFVDGVFVEQADDRVVFRAVPSPTRREMQAVTAEVCARVQRLRGLDPEDVQSEASRRRAEEEPLLAACAGASVLGQVATGPRAGARVQRLGGKGPTASHPRGRRPLGRMEAETEGFNLHAGVRVPARQRKQLERLCSYILRPPVNQDRLELLPDGRIAYHLKRAWSDGTTAVLFLPGELLEKLAALVPPPRVHQVRYHGVLSSHARLRAAVVPTPAAADPDRRCHPGRPSQMPWAALLRRVHAIDLFKCPHCGGRMRIIAAITQTTVIRAILRACGLPSAPPERPRPPTACRQSELVWEFP